MPCARKVCHPAGTPARTAAPRTRLRSLTTGKYAWRRMTSPETSGYFDPDSAIRRIGRESVLMLGGARALLMQAAHPSVAAGIVEHSDYASDPWKRLGRTLYALYTVVFGTRSEADAAGARVKAVHGGIHRRIR